MTASPDDTSRPIVPLEALVCKDFQRGSCQLVQCKYIHVARGEATKRMLLQLVYQGRGYITHCTDFLGGKCARGDDCRYVHLTAIEHHAVQGFANDEARLHGLDVAAKRKRQACRDFLAGHCRRGDAGCRYSHDPLGVAAARHSTGGPRQPPSSGSSGSERPSPPLDATPPPPQPPLPHTLPQVPPPQPMPPPPTAAQSSLAQLQRLLAAASVSLASPPLAAPPLAAQSAAPPAA